MHILSYICIYSTCTYAMPPPQSILGNYTWNILRVLEKCHKEPSLLYFALKKKKSVGLLFWETEVALTANAYLS